VTALQATGDDGKREQHQANEMPAETV